MNNDRCKYKIWDKIDKKIKQLAMLRFENGEDLSRIAAYWNDGQHNGWTDDEPNGRYILLECTGLRDKNGRLIYEGDIVKDDYYKWLIVFENAKFQARRPDEKDPSSYILADIDTRCEVIGNIYENPKLLH